LERVRQLVNSAQNQGRNIEAEKIYFNDAENNFKLVKEGKAVHNIDYALKLLENIANNLEGISEKLGNKNFKVNRSKLLTDESEYCNLCHFIIQPKKETYKFGDEDFPHQTHMKIASCTKCHSKTEHKKITVTKDVCQSCHNSFKKIPDFIQYKSIKFPHSLHSKKRNIECLTCHVTADFSKVSIKKDACTNCHHKNKELSKNCSKCHSTQNNTYSGLFDGKTEPDMMKSAGVECTGCHLSISNIITRNKPNVCGSCHDASYESTLTEWKNDISIKVRTLKSLIDNTKSGNLDGDGKQKLERARKIIRAVQTDGSKGIHNYMMFSDKLDKSIKEIKSLNPVEK
jgi:hypothetical protein